MLEVLDFFGEAFGGVAGLDGDLFLEDGLAVIEELVDIMDGDAAFGVTRRNNRFMDMAAIHSLPAVFGQQGGMDIDDPAGECLHQRRRNLPQKPRQHKKIDPLCPELGEVGGAAEEIVFFNKEDGDLFSFGDVQYARIRVIANDEADNDRRVLAEVIDDAGGVRAGARRKNSEFFHGPKLRMSRGKTE